MNKSKLYTRTINEILTLHGNNEQILTLHGNNEQILTLHENNKRNLNFTRE